MDDGGFGLWPFPASGGLPGADGRVLYCVRCAAPLVEKLLSTETRPRLVCESCGFILYQNPKLVVGTVPELDGRLVLVRRAIAPRAGTWTYPGGFLELHETIEEGALRETKEETGLDVKLTDLLDIHSSPNIGVVMIVYSAVVSGGTPTICDEVLEVACFLPEDIPWRDLSFPSTVAVLDAWVSRRRAKMASSRLAA